MTEPMKTTSLPEEQREIVQELDALRSQQERLMRVVAKLEERLAPVLRQEEDCINTDADAKESPTHTPLGGQLREVIHGIGSAAARAEYVLDKLEL